MVLMARILDMTSVLKINTPTVKLLNQTVCTLCKKGYYLNLDSQCVLLTSPLCTSAENSNI